ncbi:asparagine synthase (glutamine-hydrolyzing) [Desulfohalovibrio reitneri]|uniref:asparagine synthase (glutamine-hydrolyzing) n=1 Tax=Desulfohalovibrio reitneri TaxID=1307759 RepID=UPI0004A6E4C7|nr:asparagine synthase (glutamine-hydrolyzing) [Desulfohalovibrio reitneri]
MCGIAGIFDPSGGDLAPLAGRMADALSSRGPDGRGEWGGGAAALGHRRLAILDLSQAGAQPMASASGRFRIAYNGEIYNFRELRAELEAEGVGPFRTGTDTEVLLEAVEHWGLEDALGRCIGMFAFALWDERVKELALVRDRLGVKPLFYAKGEGGQLLFGSELKALAEHPAFNREIEPAALTLYLRHNYVPDPYCIHRDAAKLPPGHLLTARLEGDKVVVDGPRPWWSAREAWQRGLENPFSGDAAEAAGEVRRILEDAVRLRLVADVPVGVLLSGGVDSSLVAALAARHHAEPLRTFTIGFSDSALDESAHARTVAEHLGCRHTERVLEPSAVRELVPDLPKLWDEPFADASQAPTLLVSRLAREHVTVALAGDGGDELFLGYARYFWARHFEHVERFPRPLRLAAATLCKAWPGACFNLAGERGRKLRWRAGLLASRDFKAFYRDLVSHEPEPARLVPGGSEPPTPLTDPAWNPAGLDRYRRMSLWDVGTYLPGDILTKTDRASMGCGLEARVPLLDHRLVELAASLPPDLNLDVEGGGKAVLKDVLADLLPPELTTRPKQGFGVPLPEWLGGELKPWAEDLLSPNALSHGLLDTQGVRSLWSGFKECDTSRASLLWNVLMFQAWLEERRG